MSIFSSHIPFRRLADLVEGQLSPDEQTQAQTHIAACPRCLAEVTWLERTIGLMRTDKTEDAPARVIARAVRLFHPRVEQAAPGLLKHIQATLSFDSAQLPHAFGVRAEQPAARQLLYNAEQHDLDLRVEPAGEAWSVSGQVLGPGEGGQVVLQGATYTVQTMLNDLSEFILPPVPPGGYTLAVRLADVEIQVGRLELV